MSTRCSECNELVDKSTKEPTVGQWVHTASKAVACSNNTARRPAAIKPIDDMTRSDGLTEEQREAAAEAQADARVKLARANGSVE